MWCESISEVSLTTFPPANGACGCLFPRRFCNNCGLPNESYAGKKGSKKGEIKKIIFDRRFKNLVCVSVSHLLLLSVGSRLVVSCVVGR